MKKYLISIIALLALVAMLAIPAMAAGGSVTLSPASGASGEIANVTISLAGFEQATALGIEYTGALEMINEASQWKLTGGALSDIGGEKKNVSVWAVSNPVSVNGDVLKLALRMPAYDGTRSYPISVKVTVKCNNTLLGEITKSGTVTVNNPAQSVTLDKTALTLDVVGTKTATLTATVAPATTTDAVSWSSSDASVASVADGLVTAQKPGTATITATAGGKSASCTVTVICSHANAVKTSANPASCTATGNNTYYTCSCGKVLKADKTTETTVEKETLAIIPHSGGTATCTQKAECSMCHQPYGNKKAHSFSKAWSSDDTQHWHICTSCNTEKGSLANHKYSWKVDKPATEDETGLKHEECVCGKKRSEDTVINKLDHVHIGIQKHTAVAATCVKEGTVEYWTCSSKKCTGKYYADAQCQLELETVTAPIDPENHTGKSSYQSDENQHWQVCESCKNVKGEKKAHSFTWKTDKAATEYATGLKHEVCSTCKLERSKDTVIPKLPHIPTKVEGKPATCTEEGVAEHFYCANCGGYYASENGEVGALIEKADVAISALGHTLEAQWSGDDADHWHICSVCEEIADKEAHTTELVNAVEATETTEGYTGDQVCTVCEAVVEQGEVIPVITNEPTAPENEPVEPEKQNGLLIVAIAVAAAAAIGVGAFLFVKKPWQK